MQTLSSFFLEHPKAALAFSGGVDSTYLLYVGIQSGADIHPYFIKTTFQPDTELWAAKQLGERLGVNIQVLELDILAQPAVTANPADRCYYCKKALFTALKGRAAADGYAVLLDGTNASDDANDRPGMRALRELGVHSPLRERGLSKADIRALSREAGLSTWNMPSHACLATRVSTDTAITADALYRIAGAEDALFRLGFWDLRVRMLGDAARIQLTEEQITKAMVRRDAITEVLAPYFSSVLLDLKPRNGMQ